MKSLSVAGVVVIALSVVSAAACGGSGGGNTETSPSSSTPSGSSSGFTWDFNGSIWQPVGTAQTCASPFVVNLPTDLSRVSSILYPGQTRGDYKPHGGFRFDLAGQTNDVQIRAPFSGMAYRGARYVASGEVQYTLDVINPCGVMFRLGHLLDLTSRFKTLEETLPSTTELDSHTTVFAPGSLISEGEVIATAVGVRNTANVFVDFGVYDLRQRNASAADSGWLTGHPGDVAPYGVCWFDWLTSSNSAAVRALPSADSAMGKTSDYCR